MTDFSTENMTIKATVRYKFGWTDARGMWGSSGVDARSWTPLPPPSEEFMTLYLSELARAKEARGGGD